MKARYIHGIKRATGRTITTKIERFIKYILILLSHGKISVKKIHAETGISKRTLYRDLVLLESYLSIEFKHDYGEDIFFLSQYDRKNLMHLFSTGSFT
ncbi:MAG: HTH domain-containing protein [Spirochaetota bacterium]